MDAKQIHLVQETWAGVEALADTAAELFYQQLFELDPSLRALFPEDMSDQKTKLIQMLGVVIKGLTHLESIVPAIQELGRRHADYKVQGGHYDTVGQALLMTLEKGLGDAFTPEVKAAWTAAYGTLGDTMKKAAADAA